MSKESSSGLQLVHVTERFIHPQMCRVFLKAQTIKHQHVQALQCIDCRARNLAEIGQVSKVVEAIRHHRQVTVDHLQRRDLQFFAYAETPARRHDVRNDLRQTAAEMRRLEDVLENAFDVHPGTFIRTDTERAKTKVERADVVETENVIGVTVSDQNRVEMFKSKAQCLLSKVGRRIDQHGAPGMFDDE